MTTTGVATGASESEVPQAGPGPGQKRVGNMKGDWVVKYWVGQKVRSGFFVRSYGKTQMNVLANPIDLNISKVTRVYFSRQKHFKSSKNKIPRGCTWSASAMSWGFSYQKL